MQGANRKSPLRSPVETLAVRLAPCAPGTAQYPDACFRIADPETGLAHKYNRRMDFSPGDFPHTRDTPSIAGSGSSCGYRVEKAWGRWLTLLA